MGVAWQTKVDRKKKGTRWSCTRGSLTGVDWLDVWYELLIKTSLDDDGNVVPRDYLLDIPNDDNTGFKKGVPFTYEYFLPVAIEILRSLGIPEHKLRGLHLSRRWAATGSIWPLEILPVCW